MVDETRKQEATQWVKKGRAALKARDIKLAQQCLLKARDLDPENTEAWLYLTMTTRDPGKRRMILERVLAIDPDHKQARLALAKLNQQSVPHFEDEDELPPAPPPPSASRSGPQKDVVPPLPLAAAKSEEALPVAAAPSQEPPEIGEDSVRLDTTSDAGQGTPVASPPSAAAQRLPDSRAVNENLSLPSMQEMTSSDVFDEEEEPESVETVDMGRCPRCGAVMRQHRKTGEAVCVFCGYRAGGETQGGQNVVRRLRPERLWDAVKYARHCLSCDTISLLSGSAAAETGPCPICQQAILEAYLGQMSLPDGYLPFEISEAQAAIALEDAGTGGVGRLLRRQRQMSRPRRIYIPVWYFSGTGRVEYELAGRLGAARVHIEEYEAVPVHTVPQFDGDLLRLVSDVDLTGVRPFEDVQDVCILLPGVPAQTALAEARALMINDTRQKTRRHVRDADSGSERDLADSISFVASDTQDVVIQLILMPAWINEVRDGGRVSMGLVNGMTGKAALGSAVRRKR